MNNLLSYCGLVDAKIRASDKDLPVERIYNFHLLYIFSLESGLSIGSSSNARAPIKKTRLQSDACELFRSQQIIGRTFQIKQLFKVKI